MGKATDEANRYALGLDFGTESVRAVLVGTQDGTVAGDAVVKYPHGVITETLPDSKVRLKGEWALQHPDDYLTSVRSACRKAIKQAGVRGEQVCGVGVSFTACTMMPTTTDGTPLCTVSKYAKRPNAWCKLWKHHASQPQADRINDLARQRGVRWLARYGGIVSSEWFLPKALQCLDEDPKTYHAADIFIEAGEWFVWKLTGQLSRSTCHGGYKQCWHKREGYPAEEFLQALHRDFADIVPVKMRGARLAPGQCAGYLTPEVARLLGLQPGTAVSASIIDAHSGVPGAGVTGPDVLVMVMGTSTCHMIMGREESLALAERMQQEVLPW